MSQSDFVVPQSQPTEPVFNTFRRKPLRPFYSLREFMAGVVCLLVLGAVAAWVAWRGKHPDPTLFAVPETMLTAKGSEIVVYKRPLEPWIEPGGPARLFSPPLEPFPSSVLSEGWKLATAPQVFDSSTLYNKINGRETFYKAFGFHRLHFLSLQSTGQPELSVDIELFDLGSIENALGALTAEISSPETVTLERDDDSISYLTRNGGFLCRGRYYARLIGSDDHPLVRDKTAALRTALLAALPGEPLPWAYELFVGRMNLPASRFRYQPQNAFSFDFAARVYSAGVTGGDTELFLSRCADPDAATKMARQFAEQFGAYGRRLNFPEGEASVVALYENELVRALEGVVPFREFVLGVRLARTREEALGWLDQLRSHLTAAVEAGSLPPHSSGRDFRAASGPAAGPPTSAGAYE